MNEPKADFQINDEGSIFLLLPLTEAGKGWVEEHIPEDAMTWGEAIVVEHRYIRDIAEGILTDGLTVAS
jgi:hypothetical protein